jgi:methionine-rich copper-binding protein CopC
MRCAVVRRWRWAVWAVWAVLAGLACLAAQLALNGQPVAEAHAELVSSYPAPGAKLSETPVEIRLTFSERIGAASSIQLFGPQFRAISQFTSGPDPAAPEQLRGFPPRLAPDIYTVEWNAASLDGHPVSGSFAFEVTAPAGAAPWPPFGLLLGGLAALLVAGGAAWAVARRRLAKPARRDSL